MRFNLECEEGTTKVSVSFNEETLPNIVNNIQIFLKAAGFQLENLDYDIPDS